MTGLVEDAVRAAAIEWVRRASFDGEVDLTRAQLSGDFAFAGNRFPLVDAGRGIRKPAGWSAALSILTVAPSSGGERPYEDAEGPDGLHRYKLRRDSRGSAENEGLRAAMRQGAPLIWFVGVSPGVFHPIAPVYLVDEEPELDQFVVALSEEQRLVSERLRPDTPVEAELRRYLVAETRRRLHQPLFAGRVMAAYQTRCAVCALGHRRLLDAAHIVPDSQPGGEPVVPNGLALCKIHHAAYDSNVLGIRPDYSIAVHQRLLKEIDGPMLKHGIQEHHDRRLMTLPAKAADRPDPERLEQRYAQFCSAA